MDSTSGWLSDRISSPLFRSTNRSRLIPSSPQCSNTPYPDSVIAPSPNKKFPSNSDLLLEKSQVYELSTWEKKIKDFDSIQIIKEAQQVLDRRLNHENSVEEAINTRKKSFRATSSSPSTRSITKEEYIRHKQISHFYKEYEDELQKAHHTYQTQLDKMIEKRQSMRSELSGLREELKQTQEDLDNCKFELEKLERNKKILKKRGEAARYFSRKSTFREEIFKKESKCADIGQELSMEIKKNGKILENIDHQCAVLRKELSIIKFALVEHYKKILKEGKDSRSEGLQWVVLQLWALGEKVSRNEFAWFLDEDSVACVLKIAEKNKELEDLLEKISVKLPDKTRIMASNKEKLNEIHLRLAIASKSIRMKRPEKMLDENKRATITWENLVPAIHEYRMNSSKNLIEVQRITEIRNNVKMIKDLEASRLFKLCFMSSYDLKHRVSFKTLLSAIVGYENIDKYSSLVIKLKREIKDRLMCTKTFRFFSET